MKFLTLSALLLTLSTKSIAMNFNVSPVHKVFENSADWLNTSRSLTAEDLKGRVILADFWTYCCINCIHIIPKLKEIEAEFGDKLTVIGVHSGKFDNEKNTQNIREAMMRYGIEHPVVNDENYQIWRSFGVRAWPTLLLINQQGEIANAWSGEGDFKVIRSEIQKLLKEESVTSAVPIALEKDKLPEQFLHFPSKMDVGMLDGEKVLFVSDSSNHRILVINTNTNKVKHIIGIGKDGDKDAGFEQAQLSAPQGVLFDGVSKLYIADTQNHKLKVADFTKKEVITLSGTGERGHNYSVFNQIAKGVDIASPWDLSFSEDKQKVNIAMAGTHQLWAYDIKDKTISVIAGNGRESIDDGGYPFNSLSQPSGMVTLNGKTYFVDSETSSLRVMEKGRLTTLIGTGLFDFGYKDGDKSVALMQHPLGITAYKNKLYIADSYNHKIRIYDPETALLSTYNIKYPLKEPAEVQVDGDTLYIADTNQHRIIKVNLLNDQAEILKIVTE